jgi:iron(III) transport system ATP-binding protein
MANLLEISGVQHGYNGRRVLSDFSLVLARGQIGCVLGPSGCGKTTALRCIAGFENIAAGSITVSGKEVSRPGRSVPPEDRRVGMVFQDYALFPHLTVADNVGFGLHRLAPSERAQRIAQTLEMIGMSRSGPRFPHELSGGQQQRVALARALAPQPELLLLDEPFSNLDVDLRERLGLEVRDILKQQNMTAILVTHDQQDAFAIADEIGIMKRGRIEQWGTPYDLYHKPATRFVADFVGQGAFLPGKVLPGRRIQLELGTFQSNVPGEWAQGTGVDVLLRPDDILHDDASPLQARVLHKAFRGAEFLYTLQLPDGGRVLSLVPSHHNHAVGEKIGIRLEIDHVVAFLPEPAVAAPATPRA